MTNDEKFAEIVMATAEVAKKNGTTYEEMIEALFIVIDLLEEKQAKEATKN